MIRTIFVLLVGSLTVFVRAESPAWQTLLNGRNLEGWSGDPTIWSVQDGILQGSTHGVPPLSENAFLIWQDGEVADFELRLDFRLEGGNSGVQYRSHVPHPDQHVVGGYQADMDAEHTYTGILYEEQGRGILTERGRRTFIDVDGQASQVTFARSDQLRAYCRAKAWNSLRIVARGPRLQHWVNGHLMSETEDLSLQAAASGVLALQVHRGPEMTVQFRNIRLRRLDSATSEGKSIGELATPAASLTLPPGFRAELIYSVPTDQQGSWVAMTVDPQGRILVSDQYGALYRVTPAPVGVDPRASLVERLPLQLGMAQGMTFVGNQLYVVVNCEQQQKWTSGLYRLTDRDGDGELEHVELLRALDGSGEHGPHAVIPSPDGKSLYVLAGNHTKMTELAKSRVPLHWQEDHLLHRLWDAQGHAVGILAPGGYIAKTDLDGRSWELISMGYRNPYDMALNQAGELFTYDADMEWDIGTPWYRPTRICHVTSGTDFGWRSGSAKMPSSFPDTLPPIAELGPGSPTGITFGYQTSFPEEFRRALFVCDWSFGRILCSSFAPRGASYGADVEEFVTGTPLPLTDIVVRPQDGTLYFAIGGRRTQSGLYRVTYAGESDEIPDTSQDVPASGAAELFRLRRSLESLHGHADPAAIDRIWKSLGHSDRVIRYAARIALEWQPQAQWQARSLAATDARRSIESIVALARCCDPTAQSLASAMLASLTRWDWSLLDTNERLAICRAAELIVIRTGNKTPAIRQQLSRWLLPKFPAGNSELDQAMARLLAYAQAVPSLDIMLDKMENSPTQEEQIAYAYALRSTLAMANRAQLRRYFDWFPRQQRVYGGASLRGFLDSIRQDAAAGLPTAARTRLNDLIDVPLVADETAVLTSDLPVVKEYTAAEVLRILDDPSPPTSPTAARQAFAKALCFKCHRVGPEGGATGPDLTTASRRFSVPYLVESVIEPNKVVSDRFRTSSFVLQNGKVVTGRVANMSQGDIRVVTDMLRPGDFSIIRREDIAEISAAEQSEMPHGLLNTLTEAEIRNLFAFLRGDGITR